MGILWSLALANGKSEYLAIGQSEARKGNVMSAVCAQLSSTAGTATNAASYCLPCTGFTFLQDTRSFQHTHTKMLFRSKLSCLRICDADVISFMNDKFNNLCIEIVQCFIILSSNFIT